MVGRKCVPTLSPATALRMTPGRRPSAITTCAPDCVASRAASIFVAMPPVPRCPAWPAAASSIAGPMRSTCSMSRASGSLAGSAVWSPAVSVRISSRSASTRFATWAERLSLSPIAASWISSIETTSFISVTDPSTARWHRPD